MARMQDGRSDYRPAVSPLAPHTSTATEIQERIRAASGGEPYLLWRDGADAQRLLRLARGSGPVTIGRGERSAVCLSFDPRTSRLHAEVTEVDDDWLVVDDGLSRNGTFLNDARVSGRRRLRDGDLIRVGGTLIAFCRPDERHETTALVDREDIVAVSPAQRRVLVELCRPTLLQTADGAPPTNGEIAQILVLSVDAVKTHVRALMSAFEVGDAPQSQRRALLIDRAVRSGVVGRADLAG